MANLQRIATIIDSLTSQISDAEQVLREEGVPSPKDFLAEAMNSELFRPAGQTDGLFAKIEPGHEQSEPARRASKRSPART
jgi:hypothetical protein